MLNIFTRFKSEPKDVRRVRTSLVIVLVAVLAAVNSFGAQSAEPMMRAVVIHGYSGPEVLKLEQARAVARIRNALKKVER